jgi:hypothetical protein
MVNGDSAFTEGHIDARPNARFRLAAFPQSYAQNWPHPQQSQSSSG